LFVSFIAGLTEFCRLKPIMVSYVRRQLLIPRGLDEIDMALKARLTESTRRIRTAIVTALEAGRVNDARQMVLNFYWLKLGAHELLFDRTQLEYDEYGHIRKGRWALDESEKWRTLSGIRNRIVNVIRYGEFLEDKYVLNLNRRLPGFSRNTRSTFLSSAFSWNRYAMCAFDCGPVLWSKKAFVHFSQVKKRMNRLEWVGIKDFNGRIYPIAPEKINPSS
jgi:hypothetical protein